MHLDGLAPPPDAVEPKARDEKDDDLEDLKAVGNTPEVDAFGDEANAEVKYKTLKWWYVPCRAWGWEPKLM